MEVDDPISFRSVFKILYQRKLIYNDPITFRSVFDSVRCNADLHGNPAFLHGTRVRAIRQWRCHIYLESVAAFSRFVIVSSFLVVVSQEKPDDDIFLIGSSSWRKRTISNLRISLYNRLEAGWEQFLVRWKQKGCLWPETESAMETPFKSVEYRTTPLSSHNPWQSTQPTFRESVTGR